MRTAVIFCCIATTLIPGLSAYAQTPRYTVTGFLGRMGANYPRTMDLSDDGVLVGAVQTSLMSTDLDGYVFQNNVVTKFAEITGGQRGTISQRNASGEMVGRTLNPGNPSANQGFLWSGTTLTTFGDTSATAINNSGRVVINSDVGLRIYENNVMTTIGGFPGISDPENMQAYDINESGEIVGRYRNAFRYDGTFRGITTQPDGTDSTAYAINDSGVIVGDALVGSRRRGFMYSSGGVVDIGFLPNRESYASDINNLGQVVGFGDTGMLNAAFLYENSTITDLNSLIDSNSGWYLTRALTINNSGQIAGIGTFNNQAGMFLLTPTAAVPEPGSLVLVLLGIVGLVTPAARSRRRTVYCLQDEPR